MRDIRTGRWSVPRAARVAAVAGVVAVLMLASCAERPSGDAAGGSMTPVATVAPTSSRPSETPKPQEPRKPEHEEPSPSPSVDPYALADGVYPAYIRNVDVVRGSVTVDVVQTFEGWRAQQAALDDGLAPWKARRYKFAPVYVRNENPLLRTLSVGPDATIDFWQECEGSSHGAAAIRELAERALPYSTDWYYSLTVEGGVVQHVVQHIAISAC